MAALDELAEAYQRYAATPISAGVGRALPLLCRPTHPLYYAGRFSRELGKGQIYLKREDQTMPGPMNQ